MNLPLRAVILALALLLAGCGATAGPGSGGTSGATVLACSISTAAHPIDVMSVMLNCAVTHAPSDAASFRLQYTVQDSLGHPRTLGAPCDGALTNGSGTCTQSFSLPIPLDPATATVSGTLQPGGQGIGPVIPKQQPTPAGTPSLPLGG